MPGSKRTGKTIGKGLAGPGRPPGIPNKVTLSVQQALQASFDQLGPQWFVNLANKHPVAYANVIVRLIPNVTNVNVSGGLAYTTKVVQVADRDPIPQLPILEAEYKVIEPSVCPASDEPDPFD